MPAPLVALAPIVTAVGRFAVPYLAKELGKIGTNKFVQTYGNEAFTSLNETLTKNTTMVNPEAMPMVNPSFKAPGVIAPDAEEMAREQEKLREMTKSIGLPADPSIKPDIKTGETTPPKIDTTEEFPSEEEKLPNIEGFPSDTKQLPVIFEQRDVKKQTEQALEPKVEFGPLTETEKQTARALMGNQPEFYSRVVKSIEDAKQNKFTKGKWKSIIQSNSTKDEMDYLGLTEYLKGNESITKEELLKFVEKKDIAPNITVRSIPKDEMNKMYETYSLGGYTAGGTDDTQEHIVFQFGRDKIVKDIVTDVPYSKEGTEFTPLFKSEHFDTEYGTNTFAHARTQVGYDPLEGEMDRYQDLNNEEIEEAFRNTLIIDEIQSDYIQRGQDKGFIGDFDIVPEDKLIEYLEKNNIFYKLSKAPTEFTDKESGVDVIEFQQSGPIKPGDAPILETLNVGYDKNFIFNKSDKTHYVTTGENINPVQYLMSEGKVPDFPIKESKKFVELVLNKMIEKAVLDGRDSIAITNGQIQANRYDAMGKEEKEGLKKFYDEIVLKQLEKIANKYNVKLEKINISEGEAPKELQGIHLDNQIKRAQEDGFVLKKVDLQFLWDRTKDTYIPGHAALYSDTGVGQGADFIENYLNQLVESRERGSAASGLSLWDQIKKNEVYIWIKEQTISPDRIGWELPIVAVKDAYNTIAGTPETQQRLETLSDQDIEVYTQYLKGIKLPENENIGPEQLIKMKLPKKLQKERLSKPIKLTKAKTQTDRLFA